MEGSHIKAFGYVDDCAKASLSPEDRLIHNEILKEIDQEIDRSKKKEIYLFSGLIQVMNSQPIVSLSEPIPGYSLEE
jgi:hypothetical protein